MKFGDLASTFLLMRLELYLFVASLHSTVLGVLMALSPRIWYAFYQHTTGAHGLSALEDQQWAGVIMWLSLIHI